MNQDLFDWLLLLGRWLHITTAVTWIGTSIFFMWLDRSFEPNPTSTRPGHIGELWMVHGGGFYHVEKLQMGPTPVPPHLHWFKWEAYWTWMSGFLLLLLTFYSSGGAFLIDTAVSSLGFAEAVLLSLFTIFGSWFFYDFLWERSLTRERPYIGHTITIAWVAGMAYFLCHTLSGRAAYLHIGAMMGTWMTANVFLRIIPRQIEMVRATKRGEPVNADWPKNAKNRSTHNTYFTLPVIFLMLSNHFPSTYGHEYNWQILLAVCCAGAAIREYFVKRLRNPSRAKGFALIGFGILAAVVVFTSAGHGNEAASSALAPSPQTAASAVTAVDATPATPAAPAAAVPDATAAPAAGTLTLSGTVHVEGAIPPPQKLDLPSGCAKQYGGAAAYSNIVESHDGLLKNALVRIVQGQESLPAGVVPTTPVVLDQKGCLYHPRLAVARLGQEVIFQNSDPVFHNVRSFGTQNDGFNLSMPIQGQRLSKRFDKPEIPLQTKCSVHPWMEANIAIVDNAYFAVSDDNGKFSIAGLKPGSYTVEAWHEYYGKITQTLTLPTDAVVLTLKK